MISKEHNFIDLYKNHINQKNIDFGNGRLAVSLHQNGRVHSINTFHPKYGYITMSPMENFSNDKWYDSNYVRDYRSRIATTEKGFGLQIAECELQPKLLDWNTPFFYSQDDRLSIESLFLPIEMDEKNYIIQKVKVTNHSLDDVTYHLDLGGSISIGRSSYGQLTEGGPIEVPHSEVELKVRGHQMLVQNEGVEATGIVSFFKDGKPVPFPAYSAKQFDPLHHIETFEETLSGNSSVEYSLTFMIQPSTEDFLSVNIDALHEKFRNLQASKHTQEEVSFEKFVIERNFNYIHNCCALPVSDQDTCLITDHQFLPLSWNRDAYFMVKLLFHHFPEAKDEEKDRIKEIIQSHIHWMFAQADRPEGYWGRSYLATGYCKDNVFQLDQQCYPLLEICDYVDYFQEPELIHDYKEDIEDIVRILFSQQSEEAFLFKTEETPADDDVEYPYHLSSQILLWYTFKKLSEIQEQTKFTSLPFSEWTNRIYGEIEKHFVTEREGRTLYAYLTDLKGNYRFYHDANDLPFILAPIWGYCDSTNPHWVETMQFALSPENIGGYYSGKYGGLGSVHTRHAWPLGFGQELLFAYLQKDELQMKRIKEKLEYVMENDGMFSEAINEHTGEVTSREWFSWPGAFISSVFLMIENKSLTF